MSRTPVWTPGLTEGRQTSEGPLEPGATLVYRGTFLGRSYGDTRGLYAFSENKQFATKSTAGPGSSRSTPRWNRWQRVPQVTSFYRGESRGFFKLAEPLVVRLTRKHFEAAADNLRALLEDHAL